MARKLSFRPGFLWGVSTSAHQFEGGNLDNQWAAWERRGGIRSGHACAAACNWWERAEADLDLCYALGLNAIRISVDWGRVEPIEGKLEPERPGALPRDAVRGGAARDATVRDVASLYPSAMAGRVGRVHRHERRQEVCVFC